LTTHSAKSKEDLKKIQSSIELTKEELMQKLNLDEADLERFFGSDSECEKILQKRLDGLWKDPPI
jgi:antitoxin component HigA of HigAB toxin-antitoxin module